MGIRLFCFVGLLTVAVMAIIGCASIIHGSGQTVTFQSTPTGATVEVTDAMGFAYGNCETPCSIELKRKREYKVLISKGGYSSAELVIQRKSDGWIWGNLLFGGVIGLIVDFSNGAAYKLSPDELQATLTEESLGTAQPEGFEQALLIFDLDELSAEERAKIVKFDPIPWPSSDPSAP